MHSHTYNNRHILFRIIIICIHYFVLVSCATLNPVLNDENRIRLTPDKISLLNGNYALQNIFNGKHLVSRLDNYLINDQYEEILSDDSKYRIQLTALDENSIKVTLIKDQAELKEGILKGHIKDNYFNVNLDFNFRLWLILNGFSWERMRLTKLSDGTLSLDYASDAMWLIVFFPIIGTENKKYNIPYKSVAVQ